MRLDGLSASSNVDLGQTKTTRTPSTTESNATDGASTVPATETFQPTGGYDALLKQVQNDPVVRSEVVASAASKLNNGELDTPTAKAQVVQAILQSMLGS